MRENIAKRDLRVVKTTKMLNLAMFSLLKRHSFKKITVRDICEAAQISRATFYARFSDKYDFLKSWMINLVPDGLDRNNTLEENCKIHNDNFNSNKQIIRNLLIDMDSETMDIIAEFILAYYLLCDKYDVEQVNTKQIVLTSFFTGGMIFYLLLQIKNKFPPEVIPINIYLYELIEKFREWELDAL